MIHTQHSDLWICQCSVEEPEHCSLDNSQEDPEVEKKKGGGGECVKYFYMMIMSW